MSHKTEFKASKAEIMGKSRDNYNRKVQDYPNEMPYIKNKKLEEVADIIRDHVQKIKGHKYFELDIQSVTTSLNEIKAKVKVTSLFSEETSTKIFYIDGEEVINIEEKLSSTE